MKRQDQPGETHVHQPVIKPTSVRSVRRQSADILPTTLPHSMITGSGDRGDHARPLNTTSFPGSSPAHATTDVPTVSYGTPQGSHTSQRSSSRSPPFSSESLVSAKQSASSLSLRSSDSATTAAPDTSPPQSQATLFPSAGAESHAASTGSMNRSTLTPDVARSRSHSSAELSPVVSRMSMNRGIQQELASRTSPGSSGQRQLADIDEESEYRDDDDDDDDDDDGAYATIASPERMSNRQVAASQFFASLNEAPKFSFHRAMGERPLPKYPLPGDQQGGGSHRSSSHRLNSSSHGYPLSSKFHSTESQPPPPNKTLRSRKSLASKSMPAAQMSALVAQAGVPLGGGGRTGGRQSPRNTPPRPPSSPIHAVEVTVTKKPKTIGNYLLSNVVLGSGQYGQVREGIETTTCLRVAVKIVKLAALRKVDRKAIQNIQREIRILRKIKVHDRCVQLLDVIERPEKEKLYLICEYAPNGSLADALKSAPANRIGVENARIYFKQLIEGLAYLHSLGIVHRDIKPANLLFGHQGLLIADFGSAELLDAFNRSDACETSSGTPAYHPPEVLSGASSFSGFKVDIWAAGVTLYQMVTGVLPFNGKGYNALIKSVTEQELALPNLLPEPLQNLLRGMLAKDESKRFSIDEIRKHPWCQQSGDAWRSNVGLLRRRRSYHSSLGSGQLFVRPPPSPTNLALSGTTDVHSSGGGGGGGGGGDSSISGLVSPKFLVQRRQSTQQFLSDAAVYLDDSEAGSTLPSEGSAGSLADPTGPTTPSRPRSSSLVYETERDRDSEFDNTGTVPAMRTGSSSRGRAPSPVTGPGAAASAASGNSVGSGRKRKSTRREKQLQGQGYEMQLDDDDDDDDDAGDDAGDGDGGDDGGGGNYHSNSHLFPPRETTDRAGASTTTTTMGPGTGSGRSSPAAATGSTGGDTYPAARGGRRRSGTKEKCSVQ